MNEKSKNDGKLWNVLRVLYYIGVFALAVYLLVGWAEKAGDKEREENDRREAEIAKEARRQAIEEMEEKMPDLEGIISDAYNPDDLISEAKEGYYTAEEVARMYKELYDDVYAEWRRTG